MAKKLALFDFDGTLTRKDTMIEFVKFVRGSNKLLLSYILLSPVLVLYKLGLFPNDRAKKIFLRFHFRGKSEEYLRKRGESFCKRILPSLFNPTALEKLQFHRSRGHDVFVVTASLDFWVNPWLEQQGLRGITTLTNWEQGAYSGKFASPNCYGPEKVRRLKEEVELEDYEMIYAYGDSRGDREMLGIADKPFKRRFL